MKRLLLVALALGGCASNPSTDKVRQQWRQFTEQQRPSFESAGDAVTLAPTPDTGSMFPTEATSDCSSCPPR